MGLILATAAGCSSTGGVSPDAGSVGIDNGEAGYGAGERAALEADELAAAAARAAAESEQLLNITTFYFDFDQSTIKQEARAALEAHAGSTFFTVVAMWYWKVTLMNVVLVNTTWHWESVVLKQ